MIDAVIEYFSGPLGTVELVGTIASLICVYLAVKENIWTWFWGTIGVLAFGYLFYQVQLYSDAGLQFLFFLPCQFIGYYWWKYRGIDNEQPTVRRLDQSAAFGVAAFIIGATITTGFLMSMTDASFPFADALTTWMSVCAQILMIRKYWESWILWVSMDAIAIVIYLAKGLVVTSGLYVVFFVLAAMGGYAWWKSWKAQTAVAESQ